MIGLFIHVVKKGETAAGIAAAYGVSKAHLALDNGIPESGAPAVGEALVVRRPAKIHAVVSGETISSVAREEGVSVPDLLRRNTGLYGESGLTPGRTLVIA